MIDLKSIVRPFIAYRTLCVRCACARSVHLLHGIHRIYINRGPIQFTQHLSSLIAHTFYKMRDPSSISKISLTLYKYITVSKIINWEGESFANWLSLSLSSLVMLSIWLMLLTPYFFSSFPPFKIAYLMKPMPRVQCMYYNRRIVCVYVFRPTKIGNNSND